jgi:hypothetical protein
MSELRESRWAVMSERGCEASGLSYDEARGLMLRLVREKVRGLCIITDEAARHIAHKNDANQKSVPSGEGRGRA